MSRTYRGDQAEQLGISRWFRDRWQPGSCYVLDIDRLVCHPSGQVGVLIEEKHVRSLARDSRITRLLAHRADWWSALFVYSTHDDTHMGDVTRIDATLWDPHGPTLHRPAMSFDWFDQWVCRELGAQPRQALL